MHPLTTLTEQEIFTRAYNGLKAQNWTRSVNLDKECAYDNGNGLHCAIGLVCVGSTMPKELTSPSDDRFWRGLKINPKTVPLSRKHFLVGLQREGHDWYEHNGDTMQAALQAFAAKHNLECPD